MVPPPWPIAPEVTRFEYKECEVACRVELCRCEGFGKCIGRSGHLQRPHRCRVRQEISSSSGYSTGQTSSSSQGPPSDQASHAAQTSMGSQSSLTYTGEGVRVCSLAESVTINIFGSPEAPGLTSRMAQPPGHMRDPAEWEPEYPRNCSKCQKDQMVTSYTN